MSEEISSVHYINYLELDKVLDSQHPISKDKGNEAHRNAIYHHSSDL